MDGFEFQGIRFPFMDIRQAVAGKSGKDDITLTQIPSGHLRVYTRIVFQDEDNNATRINVYVGGLGQEHLMAQDASPDGDECYIVSGSVFVPENRWLIVRFVGATASDTLKVYTQGFDLIQPVGARHA